MALWPVRWKLSLGRYPVVEVSSLKSCLYVDCSSSQENVEVGCTFSVSSAMNSLDGGFDQRKSVQTIGKNGSCLSTFAKHCTLCKWMIIIDHHWSSFYIPFCVSRSFWHSVNVSVVTQSWWQPRHGPAAWASWASRISACKRWQLCHGCWDLTAKHETLIWYGYNI